ncbi:IucA/IucC family protein [Metabacillus sediminilitoris]|uniref:IucA/IucC family protein n=1 Tax=Metabacillus sediminilitoris TaxID=2567941 RepID=A0A4S4BQF2_9BACI|nr:IucA/IucC family protein [Metabacillus sediminilitoris]QGQ45723.1 IucA/IucC family protein [Metabacillus sediminilitoris]THF77162.1 IucA/IucC family protein [Metabacillus sediminilitoris]
MSASSTQLLERDVLHTVYRNFRQEYMLEDELKVLTFLETNYPDMVPAYVFSLARGRQGILRRLAGAMLREDIMGLTSSSYDLYIIDSIQALNVPAIDEYWQMVIRTLHTYGLESGKIYKLYPLCERECLVIPVTRTYAFNRVEVDGVILHVSEDGVRTIEHAVELLQLMRHKEEAHNEIGQSAWVKLAEELVNGSANLALSYAYWKQKKKELQKKADEHGITTTIDWVLLQKMQDREFDSSLFFEQLSVEGHNLHPGTKTKIGMEPEDVFRYAPEFDGVADIHFVGIHKDYAEWVVIEENEEDANAFLFKEYPELPKAVKREFAEHELSVNDYVLVPVHPWQLEKALPDIYHQEIKEQIVVPIRGMMVRSGATSSFRTVVPFANGETPKHAIKVAVNSQMTSTVRSISANTTNNATVFTRLIRSIMQQEQDLVEKFVPVCECAGFNFKIKETEGLTGNHKLKSRNLSAVLRENVESFVALDEVAIVGSSLFAESPITEKLILVELIEMYAEKRKETSLRKAAFQFVSEYVSIALPGFLTLMVKYGIGLEGHLQNSVMVFKDGRPVRMLFRDWGGTRIYRSRLQQHQEQVQFYPGSVTVTDSLKEMHNKVFYTVLQNHCGELVLQVCKHFGLGEGELWQEIHRICKKVFDQLESLPHYSESVRIDRKALYQAEVDHKALAKMRLEPEGKEYSYAIVPNPLHEFSRKEE